MSILADNTYIVLILWLFPLAFMKLIHVIIKITLEDKYYYFQLHLKQKEIT
jgi:hypothetical protein